jgi:hypothetical protein
MLARCMDVRRRIWTLKTEEVVVCVDNSNWHASVTWYSNWVVLGWTNDHDCSFIVHTLTSRGLDIDGEPIWLLCIWIWKIVITMFGKIVMHIEIIQGLKDIQRCDDLFHVLCICKLQARWLTNTYYYYYRFFANKVTPQCNLVMLYHSTTRHRRIVYLEILFTLSVSVL